ncbi:MAG TPA: glycosyltransferase family 10 [Verrucomicrobiae bacterium]|nr:glycosyltransferase family 10 [Verrucomicrobiae bacterium]
MKQTISLDFCNFWPGFVKTSNFFFNLLSERFDVRICDQPDFLIYSDGATHLHRLQNCVRIYFSTESFLPDFRQCDYAFTSRYVDDPRHFRLPYYVLTAAAALLIKRDGDPPALCASRPKFCAFVVSNVHSKKTKKRIDFFHRLSKYKKVDSAGTALNNVGSVLPRGPLSKLTFLKEYKFNIAFENAAIPGYTTEKLIEPMLVRCLPIYWGNPRVAEEFNPKSFLNYPDFPNEDALIEKIIELDRDDAKYMEYQRQPYFHNNTPNPCFDRNRLLDHFERIFTTKIRPVSARRGWIQIGRWIPAKKNRPH